MPSAEPHPQVQAVLDRLDDLGVPDLSELSVTEARTLFDRMSSTGGYSGGPVTVADREIAGDEGPIPIRTYRPERVGPLPTTVYFHGGGFVLGNLDTHDATCRALADLAETVVVSVDYRRAPEHRFPAAVHDAYETTVWARDHAEELGGTEHLVVAGDSAGGTLAAVVALLARDREEPRIDYQVLFYPGTSASSEWDSISNPATGQFLSAAEMEWFGEQYLEDSIHSANRYAFPLEACSHEGLPPATVVTAGFDPLHDEGVAYAEALEDAGVSLTHRDHDDMVHGFVGMIGYVDRSETVIEAIGEDLSAALFS